MATNCVVVHEVHSLTVILHFTPARFIAAMSLWAADSEISNQHEHDHTKGAEDPGSKGVNAMPLAISNAPWTISSR